MLKQLHDSVPPTQRLASWFITKPTAHETIQHRKRLVKGSLKGAWGEIYENDLLYQNGEIDFTHPDLPAWITHADRIASSPPLSFARDLGTTPKSRELFFFLSPITNYGYNLLTEHLSSIEIEVSDIAIQGMIAGLGHRIMQTCVDIADIEISAWFNLAKSLGDQKNPQITIDSSTYPDLYERYPALAFIIGHGIGQWFEAVKEMTSRLAEDLPRLQEFLFNSHRIHRLEDVSMDTGDIHDDGRSVALLTFNNEQKVAYKPKDLRIAKEVQDLFDIINNKIGKKILHVRTIIVGQGYAWEEFIPHSECNSSLDISLYYQRYGAMVRIYELLQARDLWLDNVIAHGAWPVVIDLEMVMQPWMAPSEAKNACEFHAQELIEQTALPIGLISMMFPIDADEPLEDMGGLTPHRPFRTPFRMPSIIEVEGKSNSRVYLNNDIYTPRLGTSIVNSQAWLDDVQKGYNEMDQLIEDTVQPDIRQWLDQLNPSFPVRAIYRDTWTYQQILNSSCAGKYLRSVFHREAYLAKLPTSLQFLYPSHSAQSRIVFSEIEQLRQLDIPYFISELNDGELRESTGKSLGTIFHGSPLASMKQRCYFPAEKDFRRDCLAGALETGHGSQGTETRIVLALSASTLETIHEISHLLLSWSINLEGDYAWITYTAHPATKTVVLQSIRPTYPGMLKAAIALRKAQLCTGLSSLTPAIQSLRRQVDVCRNQIIESIAASCSQPWHHSEEDGLPGIERGKAHLDELLMMGAPSPTTKSGPIAVQLLSTTRIPPRLWLLGEHGVFALLDSLCSQHLAHQDAG